MKGRFNPELRKLYSEKVLDLTNIGVVATLFGQFLSEDRLSGTVTIVGLAILIVGYVISYIIYTKK